MKRKRQSDAFRLPFLHSLNLPVKVRYFGVKCSSKIPFREENPAPRYAGRVPSGTRPGVEYARAAGHTPGPPDTRQDRRTRARNAGHTPRTPDTRQAARSHARPPDTRQAAGHTPSCRTHARPPDHTPGRQITRQAAGHTPGRRTHARIKAPK